MEAALFNAFVEQQNCGVLIWVGNRRHGGGPVIAAVQGVYDGAVVITKSHCQGIYKSHYRDHVWLERQSGFSFDKETGLFDAAPEAWEELLKVYQLC